MEVNRPLGGRRREKERASRTLGGTKEIPTRPMTGKTLLS